MEAKTSFGDWWRPLPLWLKWVSALMGFPAWVFIAYSVLSAQGTSAAALAAFGVFALVVALHIVFDRRNRRGRREHSAGVDITDGGE